MIGGEVHTRHLARTLPQVREERQPEPIACQCLDGDQQEQLDDQLVGLRPAENRG